MYKKILQEHNLSVTQKRITLLEILDRADKPVTIDMIKDQLSADMNITTIYRSLKKLVDVGIVYQTDFRDGASYFEFQGDNHHHHVTCTECKNRTSIDVCVNKKAITAAEEKGYSVTNHIFELFGLCNACSK